MATQLSHEGLAHDLETDCDVVTEQKTDKYSSAHNQSAFYFVLRAGDCQQEARQDSTGKQQRVPVSLCFSSYRKEKNQLVMGLRYGRKH